MPPRHRSSSGYRGVRAWPNGTFYAEIRSGEERIGLGTFEMAHEAARAYDAVAWRLGRPRRSMNFDDVTTRAQAEMLAPPPPVVTREQSKRQRDLEWREQFSEDVAAMEAFYAEKAEEKAAVKAVKKADREEHRAKKSVRKKEREEKAARKAARKKEENKNSAGPLTIIVSSSSSFDWMTSPVSSMTLFSSFWDSFDEE
jgi:hypothetical protein